MHKAFFKLLCGAMKCSKRPLREHLFEFIDGLRWLGSEEIILVMDIFGEADCYTFLCESFLDILPNINAMHG